MELSSNAVHVRESGAVLSESWDAQEDCFAAVDLPHNALALGALFPFSMSLLAHRAQQGQRWVQCCSNVNNFMQQTHRRSPKVVQWLSNASKGVKVSIMQQTHIVLHPSPVGRVHAAEGPHVLCCPPQHLKGARLEMQRQGVLELPLQGKQCTH